MPYYVAAAEACRELQECHTIFNRAGKLMKARPSRAQALFAEIVERAPGDSEVHRAAKKHLQDMARSEAPGPD